MAYPAHYTSARVVLQRLQARAECAREGSCGERRAALDAAEARAASALGDFRLLADRHYAEAVAARAREDLARLFPAG